VGRGPGAHASDLYEPVSGETRANGLVGYDFEGRRLFHLFGHRIMPRLQTAGRYAYATFYQPRHCTYVIDLRGGGIVRRLPTARAPILLEP
jgi:hypothetical protein